MRAYRPINTKSSIDWTIIRYTSSQLVSRKKNIIMKSIAVFAVLVSVALAAPTSPDGEAQIVRFESDNIGLDKYSYALETSNGIKQQEEGQLANAGSEDEGIEVRGQYEFTAPDGKVYSVIYTAGKDGFQPQGEHIPKA